MNYINLSICSRERKIKKLIIVGQAEGLNEIEKKAKDVKRAKKPKVLYTTKQLQIIWVMQKLFRI